MWFISIQGFISFGCKDQVINISRKTKKHG
jgi:hypothetical protein